MRCFASAVNDSFALQGVGRFREIISDQCVSTAEKGTGEALVEKRSFFIRMLDVDSFVSNRKDFEAIVSQNER